MPPGRPWSMRHMRQSAYCSQQLRETWMYNVYGGWPSGFGTQFRNRLSLCSAACCCLGPTWSHIDCATGSWRPAGISHLLQQHSCQSCSGCFAVRPCCSACPWSCFCVPMHLGSSQGDSNSAPQAALCPGCSSSNGCLQTCTLPPCSGTWTEIRVAGQRPKARYGHCMCRIDSRILMFGGETGGGLTRDLWTLRGAGAGEEAPAWIPLELPGPAPAPRKGHACASG